MPKSFEQIWEGAVRAGSETVNTTAVRPMFVDGYRIDDGVCGFAWLTVKPGNSSFAKWLKKKGLADKAYGGGVSVWISDYNQSMEKKQAFARGAAAYLSDFPEELKGVTVSYGSRMD